MAGALLLMAVIVTLIAIVRAPTGEETDEGFQRWEKNRNHPSDRPKEKPKRN
jgi:hypothetical protein